MTLEGNVAEPIWNAAIPFPVPEFAPDTAPADAPSSAHPAFAESRAFGSRADEWQSARKTLSDSRFRLR